MKSIYVAFIIGFFLLGLFFIWFFVLPQQRRIQKEEIIKHIEEVDEQTKQIEETYTKIGDYWVQHLPAGADFIAYRGNGWITFRWNKQYFLGQCHTIGHRRIVSGITEWKPCLCCKNCECVPCVCNGTTKICDASCKCDNSCLCCEKCKCGKNCNCDALTMCDESCRCLFAPIKKD